ncbi:cyclopropane fatty acyl phospholipid synthase [Chromobacterium piscinae]|uniref:Cyclopropane fatty acyl phospholipid synthase n=2 Tax=Chromobacterium piscinae TaxID=686831 RepID=A0ABV0H104_9NEIS|nr:cyclopropane fatty acyl phospholipid synthase [Chromobacterium piscinae]MBX9298113.1 cyclopropane fatty acyl phospholipid synthase [Chromobacterium vaccinii]MBX9355538.1 cyclopropane fatty acyl phospholipid synthase [Chromobacterium vaccinii]MCD4506328.1 cyclopropane fatty acyl phospholipid synthase [Chromobacterium piscinae]MCD5326563.1 cyclopropane fatty acyl phospholipid synthase [Chromobacterium piscinae]
MNSSCLENESGNARLPGRAIIEEMLAAAGVAVNGSRPFDIQVKNPQFYRRVLRQGSLGLGESYMDGWWECERLDAFFQRVMRAGLEHRLPRRWRDTLYLMAARLVNYQSLRRARKVGEHHYDLGNDLFAAMLDPNMQYSCGYWKDAATLEEAQEAKLRLICDKLGLKPGMHLLDIGCGWGGLAAYAARHYGVRVTGITISEQQRQLALQRCAGLDVDILLQDYRHLALRADRIVSVGMFEHVGPRNYDAYFKTAARNLTPDGLFLLHTIGAKTTDLRIDPWIEKYIFPNGCLPSVSHIAGASERYWLVEDWHNFGADYDLTLMAWLQRFQQAWPQLTAHYPSRFYRMFTYYLNACAGAFRARDLQLWQVLFSREGVEGGLRVAR